MQQQKLGVLRPLRQSEIVIHGGSACGPSCPHLCTHCLLQRALGVEKPGLYFETVNKIK